MLPRVTLDSRRRVALLAVAVLACLPARAGAQPASLRFFGGGVAAPDGDRVKIRIDDPDLLADPGPPVDVGAGDFTIEFWLRAFAAENGAAAIACGDNYDWIYGHIVLDRDRYAQPRAFGFSIGGARIVFGLIVPGGSSRTWCSDSDVLDGAWHHVALERRRSDGFVWLYVDGALEDAADGPDGDVSYPDDGVPGNHCGGPCTNSDPFVVLGAEKHDAGAQYPSFSGWLDELRVSTALRYGGASFTPPTAPFAPDADTAALYHFDEGPLGPCSGIVLDASLASGGPSNGECRLGGMPQGPRYDAETPFTSAVPSGSWPFGLLLATGLAATGSAARRCTRRSRPHSR
jgi:hypothetical protein